MAPTKQLGFKPARTQAILSHALPPRRKLVSSTAADAPSGFISPVAFFAEPLAEAAAVAGVLGVPGSGADKRLTLAALGLPAVTSECSSDALLSCWFSSFAL